MPAIQKFDLPGLDSNMVYNSVAEPHIGVLEWSKATSQGKWKTRREDDRDSGRS